MPHSLRLVAAITVLALCATRPAHAQSESSGRIEGVVFDSVHAHPLFGARVVAFGTGTRGEVRREATTDSVGRYHLDSLPLGRYIVGFESALLDSLEVTLSPREATIASASPATLDLALPSAAKLRSAVCLGATLPPETGVIVGHVVDAETESPLAGVTIAMEWRDLGVDRKTLRPINRQRSDSVVTDRDGWYRMCGVATGAWVSMQVQQARRTGAVLRTRVDDTLGIAIRHLSLAATPSSGDATADNSANAPRTGTATLRGVVRGPEGAPVVGAEVRVQDTRAETRTDAQGAFTLGALPAGTQQLEIRRVGYAVVEASIDLRSGATTTHDVVLRRVVNLDSVLVVASRPKYPDFYQHQSAAAGFGVFLGPEAIAKERIVRTSDILEKRPGFRVEQRGYHTVVLSTREAQLCPATIIIDGIVVRSDAGPSIDDVHPAEIGAMEIYRAGEENFAPVEYHIGKCGGVVIWTKR